MSERTRRSFSPEFKMEIVRRIESGESISKVAAETGLLVKSVYDWRTAYQAFGTAGVSKKRGRKGGFARTCAPRLDQNAESTDPLTRAQARIVELERVIGRQQADIHFFQLALRLWDAKTPKVGGSTSSASSGK